MIEDERYELDAYLNMSDSTMKALVRLQTHYANLDSAERDNMGDEEIQQLRDKYMRTSQMKWIKHIYNCTAEMTKNDSRYDFLDLKKLVVIPIILERLQKLYKNWSDKKRDRQK